MQHLLLNAEKFPTWFPSTFLEIFDDICFIPDWLFFHQFNLFAVRLILEKAKKQLAKVNEI